jgi:hypothetical protein
VNVHLEAKTSLNTLQWVSHQSAEDQVSIIKLKFVVKLDGKKMYPPIDNQHAPNYQPQMQGFDPQSNPPYPMAPPSYESQGSGVIMPPVITQQPSMENYLKAL